MVKIGLCCAFVVFGLIVLLGTLSRVLSQASSKPLESPSQEPRIIDATFRPGPSQPDRTEDYDQRRREILARVQSGQISVEEAERLLDTLEK